MKIIVPLAGPDFDRPDGSVKAEITAENNLPLLRSTLESRPWWRRSQVNDGDLIFVIRDTAQSRRFSEVTLPSWYPRASIVKLSCLTQGAAFSALAGISLIANDDNPLCVDLVDINYASSFDPEAFFSSSGIGGVALVFESVNPMYSYVRLDAAGYVVEAAEKRVISKWASAGTYFFSSPKAYLLALYHNIANPESATYRGLFYVCPMFNGLVANKQKVAIQTVSEVKDVKTSGM